MTKEEINGFSYRIMQASPTQLVVILYEMSQNYLNQAIKDCNADDVASFRKNLRYTEQVINELIHSLDLQYEISINLMQIYLFIKKAMIRASVSKDTAELVRCVGMIEKLRVSFDKVSKEDKSGAVMQNTQQVYAGLTYGRGELTESFGLESNRGFRV